MMNDDIGENEATLCLLQVMFITSYETLITILNYTYRSIQTSYFMLATGRSRSGWFQSGYTPVIRQLAPECLTHLKRHTNFDEFRGL